MTTEGFISKARAIHGDKYDYSEVEYVNGRIKEISYPEHPENDVTYYYDCAGRIKLREDGVGSEELMYDELGNVKRSYRRVLVPTESHVYFFETRHKYDSFGKIQHIIYPDQDSVAYNYLPTGELSAVVHKSAGTGSSLQTIVSNIEYDEYGHKVHQSYGNLVETDYSYSPLRQWMTQLETRLPGSGPNIQELYYKYDYVGNITQISQQAGAWGSIGGPYTNDYTYDHQYRLVSALGSSSNNLGYNFTMSYSPSGRIWHNSCGSSFVNKQVAYGYDDQFLTHQPRVVFDTIASDSYNLYWDSNGNLHEISNCKSEKVRFHDWDEENRLRAVIGPNHIGLYGYDGDGNRVWKLISDCSQESQNGDELTYGAYIDDAVLYPNPYVTITPQGYTKHYYLGEERIAAAIGQGGWGQQFDDRNNHELEIQHYYWAGMSDKYPLGEAVDPKVDNVNAADNYPSELQYSCPPFQLERLLIGSEDKILYNCLATYSNPSGRPEDMYYTHSDHLGSASWITDSHGDPVQYIHYAPYGELLASQHAYGSFYDERYKFTGKERDAETGYDYFGARFLAQQLGIWTTPDPLLDKYIFASPYMYCNGNPIKFIDPDGEEKKNFFSKDDKKSRHFANRYKDDNRLHIFSHGTKEGIMIVIREKKQNIFATEIGAKQLSHILLNIDKSELWEDYILNLNENSEPLQVVFHGCYTAAMAEAMSKEFPDVYFTGTTEEYRSEGTKELGTYSTYKISFFSNKIDTGIKKNEGQWVTFKNGEIIKSETGPSASPLSSEEENK